MKQSKILFKFITTAVLGSLFLSIIFLSCKKEEVEPVTVDKTCLIINLPIATSLYDGAVEGTLVGQYEVGSKAAFKTVIDAANAVASDANATQDDATNACAQLAAATTTFNSHLITAIAPENLIGFWKFDGNTADSSGKGNNGVLTTGAAYYGAGIPTLTSDRFNRSNMAYHFDMGGNVEVPYTTALNPPQMTISLWCKKSIDGRLINPNTYTMLSLNRWNGYKFQLQENNFVFFTTRAIKPAGDTAYFDRDTNPFALNNEVWYHVAVAFKSGEEDLYINGVLVKQWVDVQGTPITVSSAINFVIGQDLPTDKYLTVDGDFQVAWGGFWTGDLDDVMFYNIALSAPQINSIYQGQKTL